MPLGLTAFRPHRPQQFFHEARFRWRTTPVVLGTVFLLPMITFDLLLKTWIYEAIGVPSDADWPGHALQISLTAISLYLIWRIGPGPSGFVSRLKSKQCPACKYPLPNIARNPDQQAVCPECGFDARPFLKPGTLDVIETLTPEEGKAPVSSRVKRALAR
jgi:hypothetical protein